MAITRDDVAKAAMLARLEPTEAQLDALTPQLAEIVAYVDQLSAVDTEGVEPMAHGVELSNVFRPDEVRPSLPRDVVLQSAPKHNGVGFRVPAVLGD
jgi:aspartyl-tRNA(Asn)/glutamyl-tRNA(Gln) amidotransferase subunit C